MDRFTPPFYPPIPAPEDRAIYEAFEPYGYRLIPLISVKQTGPPRSDSPRTVTVTSNSDGFRADRSFHERDPRRRIVILGDSLVFGIGVEASERFTDVLEATEPDWRIDNLGMTGFGPDQRSVSPRRDASSLCYRA